MSKSTEKISNILGIDHAMVTKEGIEVIDKTTKEIEKPITQDTEKMLEQQAINDYKTTRKNLTELIEQGKTAIDGVLSLAEQGESARTYEVVADLIRTVSGVNKDLMDLHSKIKSMRSEEINISQTNNNSIYVGSTKELQELINSNRSTAKMKHKLQEENE